MKLSKLLLVAAALPVLSAPVASQTHVRKATPAIVQAPNFSEIKSSSARGQLKSIWKRYAAAQRSFDLAAKARSRTKASRMLKMAAAGFDSALMKLSEWSERFGMKDVAVRLEAHRITPILVDRVRESHLELASAYASRGSYKMALDAVERVLRDNLRDAEARALRTQIQLASAIALG